MKSKYKVSIYTVKKVTAWQVHYAFTDLVFESNRLRPKLPAIHWSMDPLDVADRNNSFEVALFRLGVYSDTGRFLLRTYEK